MLSLYVTRFNTNNQNGKNLKTAEALYMSSKNTRVVDLTF